MQVRIDYNVKFLIHASCVAVADIVFRAANKQGF